MITFYLFLIKEINFGRLVSTPFQNILYNKQNLSNFVSLSWKLYNRHNPSDLIKCFSIFQLKKIPLKIQVIKHLYHSHAQIGVGSWTMQQLQMESKICRFRPGEDFEPYQRKSVNHKSLRWIASTCIGAQS